MIRVNANLFRIATACQSSEQTRYYLCESNADSYIEETAHELADEICARLDCTMRKEMIAERPDLYA